MRNAHVLRCLVALLLVASVTAPFVAGTATASTSLNETRDADLSIEQPHYVTGAVGETIENETQIYEVEGTPLRLYPENFDADDVVGVTVTPEDATIHEGDRGEFVLEPEETGTYTVIFEVEELVSTGNETATQRTAYRADIRVTGGLDTAVVSQDRLDALEEDAEAWQDINATANQQAENSLWYSILPGQPSGPEWIDSALDKQQLVHNPGAVFGRGLMTVFIGLVSFGGMLLLALWFGWVAKVIAYFRKKLNLHETIEDEEGELAQRFERQAIRDSQESLQNLRFTEFFLPHEADAMRELGETPYEADAELVGNSALGWVGVVFKARAMARDGYLGVVPEEIASADDADESRDTEALLSLLRASGERLSIQPAKSVDDETLTVDLSEADQNWLDVLPVNDAVMLEYDPVEADIDTSDIVVDDIEWTPEALVAQLNFEREHFKSDVEAAQYVRQFTEVVREHSATDADGRPDEVQYTLETFLRNSQLMDDRFGQPRQYLIDVLETAIANDDPVQDGKDLIDDKESGLYA